MNERVPVPKAAFIVNWKVKPGRIEEFLAVHTEGMKQMTATPGSPTYTVWQTLSGPGEEPHLQYTVVMDFASASAQGQFFDSTVSDPNIMKEMMSNYFPADASAIEVAAHTMMEVPLG